jgi:hypothetical protein
MAKKSASHRLDDARAELAAIKTQRAEKQSARDAALLVGAGAAEIAKLDAEIATLDHAGRTETDRIELLEKAVAEAKQENVAKQQASHIKRFAKLMAARNELAIKVQTHAKELEANIAELSELSNRARAAYAVHSQSARAGADSMDGAALSNNAIMDLLANEFFRISRVPFRGGHAGERTPRALPGSKCPKFEWQLTPEKVMPFADRIERASEYAVETLRAEIRAPGKTAPRTVAVPASINGAEPRPRTEAEARLAELLKQQAEAATDVTPAGEQKYKSILTEIVATTAEIDAWRSTTIKQNEAAQ